MKLLNKDNINIFDPRFDGFNILFQKVDSISNSGPAIFKLIKGTLMTTSTFNLKTKAEDIKFIYVYEYADEMDSLFINKFNDKLGLLKLDDNIDWSEWESHPINPISKIKNEFDGFEYK